MEQFKLNGIITSLNQKQNKTFERKNHNGEQDQKGKLQKKIGADSQKILKNLILIFGKNMKKNFGKNMKREKIMIKVMEKKTKKQIK